MALIPLSTLGPSISFGSSLLEQFKPSRAPYLIAVTMAAVFTSITLEHGTFSIGKKLLVLLPIFFIILVLSLLAFYFKPFEATEVSNKPQIIEEDVDAQFKLSRTTGLVVGISCLYMVADRRKEVDGLFLVLYIITISHCLVYLLYIMFRNIKEDSYRNLSYFQLSFMTSLFLFLLAFGGSKTTSTTASYLYEKCSLVVNFEGAPLPAADLARSRSGSVQEAGSEQGTKPHTAEIDLCDKNNQQAQELLSRS